MKAPVGDEAFLFKELYYYYYYYYYKSTRSENLRAQRIMGFFILITHKSTRSENPIKWLSLHSAKF